MKTLKKLNFAFVALLLGAVIAVTQSAFTPAKKVARFSDTIYDFSGTNLSQAQTASFYAFETGTAPSCNENNEIPCRIAIPAGQSLATWLSNEGSTAQVLADAIDTKD